HQRLQSYPTRRSSDLADGGARFGLGNHLQRMQHGGLGGAEAFEQVVLAVLVHQEADGAELHAEHGFAETAMAVQGLQHEAVAAQDRKSTRLNSSHVQS